MGRWFRNVREGTIWDIDEIYVAILDRLLSDDNYEEIPAQPTTPRRDVDLPDGVDIDEIVRKLIDSGALVDRGGGGTTALQVSYTNSAHEDWGTVHKALDGLIDKIEYVKPSVTSFTMSPNATEYEVGQSVTSLTFSWAYNKDIKTQSLTDVSLADKSVRTASWKGTLTSNKTFTISASDGTNSASASKTISFRHRIYWGAIEKTSGFTSADIIGLANMAFADNYRGTRSFDATAGQYAIVACPASWGMPNKCKIGGFETGLIDCGTTQFTNASGNTTTYKLVRTSAAGLGAFSMIFE